MPEAVILSAVRTPVGRYGGGLAGLVRAAQPDVLDLARRDARALDRGSDRERGEVVRSHAPQGAAITTDRGPDGADDPGVAQRAMGVTGHGRIVALARDRTRMTRRSPSVP